eukprot:s329_g13.t1
MYFQFVEWVRVRTAVAVVPAKWLAELCPSGFLWVFVACCSALTMEREELQVSNCKSEVCESLIQVLQSEMQNQFATLLLQMRDIVARELELDSVRWRGIWSKGNWNVGDQASKKDSETTSQASDATPSQEVDVSGQDGDGTDVNQFWPWHPHQPQLLQPPQLGNDKDKAPGAKLLKKGSSRMEWMDRKGICPSKAADIRHSLLHSIAELDTQSQSRDPLNHKLRSSVTAIFNTFPPPLRKVNTWISEEEPETRLAQIQLQFQLRVVETTAFESVVIFMICLNTAMIGVNCDWNLTHLNQEEPKYFQIVERFFAGVFALELFLRIFAYGAKFFCGRADWQWNWFDLIIVSFQIFEEISSLVRAGANGEMHLSSSSSAIRIIRMFRLLRILRIVRLLRFIQELRSMLLSILSTLRALGWTMVLLLMIIYAAGVFFAQFIIDAASANVDIMIEMPELQYYFSDLLRTMLSLYQSMTGGLSWDVALRPLEGAAGGWLALPYALYVAFVVLALTNIATGMFVQASLGAHERQREKEIRKQLRHLFRTADLNGDGELTWEEFDRFLDNSEQSRYFLNALNMDAREAKGLFLLLDTAECGHVSFEELLDGVLRLRGTAQAIDLATLMYCNKRMITWLRERLNAMQESVDSLSGGSNASRTRKVSVYASWNEVKTRVSEAKE